MAADVRAQVESLGGQMSEIQQGMAAIVERVAAITPQTATAPQDAILPGVEKSRRRGRRR
jgi:hypothetical protein